MSGDDRQAAGQPTRGALGSHDNQPEIGVEQAKVARVRGSDLLAFSTGTDHHVRVDDVGRLARSEKPAHVCRIDPVEGDEVGRWLADEAGETRLAFGRPDNLSERRGRNRHVCPRLTSSGQQDEGAAVVAFEGDQGSGIKGHSGHQAAELAALEPRRIPSAQARSSSERAPPVWRRASANKAPQPATTSRETATACWTNPDTLDADPASTRARIRSSCPSSRVTVTFLVTILATILLRDPPVSEKVPSRLRNGPVLGLGTGRPGTGNRCTERAGLVTSVDFTGRGASALPRTAVVPKSGGTVVHLDCSEAVT